MPLVWAHAEYLTLLRSVADGQVYDFIPEVAERYQTRRDCRKLEIWKVNRHVRRVTAGRIPPRISRSRTQGLRTTDP